MGQIVLSGDELVCILAANARMPEQVMGVETDGEEIKVHVATALPVLRSIPVRVRFAGFEQGWVVLQLMTNRLIDRFDWLSTRCWRRSRSRTTVADGSIPDSTSM